jgi:hypothetical protein
VDPVSHVAHGHLAKRPSRERLREDRATHLPVQPTDTVHRATRTHGEVRHVERFPFIAGMGPAESEQSRERHSERLTGVISQVLLEQYPHRR